MGAYSIYLRFYMERSKETYLRGGIMIYLLTADEHEAHYCAHLSGLSNREWEYASQLNENSKGSLWLYGDYLRNPHYEEIIHRTSILHLEKVNKNQ